MAIIRQVRFSMRSWLGRRDLVRLYSFHIWVPRGSFFCNSSGLSNAAEPASSFHSGKTASRNSNSFRATVSEVERSRLGLRLAVGLGSW